MGSPISRASVNPQFDLLLYAALAANILSIHQRNVERAEDEPESQDQIAVVDCVDGLLGVSACAGLLMCLIVDKAVGSEELRLRIMDLKQFLEPQLSQIGPLIHIESQ